MIRPARRLALVFLVAAACICAGVRAGSRPSLWAEELDWEDRAGQVQSDVADGGHACSCAPLQALPPPQLPCTLLGIQEGASYPAAGAPVELVCDDDKQSHASPYSRVSMRVELDGIPIPPNQRLAARGVGLHRLQTAVIAIVPPAVNESSGDGPRMCGPCATVFTGSGAFAIVGDGAASEWGLRPHAPAEWKPSGIGAGSGHTSAHGRDGWHPLAASSAQAHRDSDPDGDVRVELLALAPAVVPSDVEYLAVVVTMMPSAQPNGSASVYRADIDATLVSDPSSSVQLRLPAVRLLRGMGVTMLPLSQVHDALAARADTGVTEFSLTFTARVSPDTVGVSQSRDVLHTTTVRVVHSPTRHTLPAYIDSSVEVAPGTIVVANSNITVSGPHARLTLLPGSMLLMCPGCSIVMHAGSALYLNGTLAHPVTVTARVSSAAWGGIDAHAGCAVVAHHALLTFSGSGHRDVVQATVMDHRTETPLLHLHSGAVAIVSNSALITGGMVRGWGACTPSRCLLSPNRSTPQAVFGLNATLFMHRTVVHGFMGGVEMHHGLVQIQDCGFAAFPDFAHVRTVEAVEVQSIVWLTAFSRYV